MSFQRVPFDQQDITIGQLYAAPKVMLAIALHRRDDGLRSAKGGLELRFASRDHVQDGDLQNHLGRRRGTETSDLLKSKSTEWTRSSETHRIAATQYSGPR